MVVATGRNKEGQCNVSAWRDIIAVSAGRFHTVGLKSDGTILVAGETGDKEGKMKKWKLFLGTKRS